MALSIQGDLALVAWILDLEVGLGIGFDVSSWLRFRFPVL